MKNLASGSSRYSPAHALPGRPILLATSRCNPLSLCFLPIVHDPTGLAAALRPRNPRHARSSVQRPACSSCAWLTITSTRVLSSIAVHQREQEAAGEIVRHNFESTGSIPERMFGRREQRKSRGGSRCASHVPTLWLRSWAGVCCLHLGQLVALALDERIHLLDVRVGQLLHGVLQTLALVLCSRGWSASLQPGRCCLLLAAHRCGLSILQHQRRSTACTC